MLYQEKEISSVYRQHFQNKQRKQIKMQLVKQSSPGKVCVCVFGSASGIQPVEMLHHNLQRSAW